MTSVLSASGCCSATIVWGFATPCGITTNPTLLRCYSRLLNERTRIIVQSIAQTRPTANTGLYPFICVFHQALKSKYVVYLIAIKKLRILEHSIRRISY